MYACEAGALMHGADSLRGRASERACNEGGAAQPHLYVMAPVAACGLHRARHRRRVGKKLVRELERHDRKNPAAQVVGRVSHAPALVRVQVGSRWRLAAMRRYLWYKSHFYVVAYITGALQTPNSSCSASGYWPASKARYDCVAEQPAERRENATTLTQTCSANLQGVIKIRQGPWPPLLQPYIA